MSNLTPAQAFGHIKALWPETVRIGKDLNYGWRAFNLAGNPTAGGSTGIHLDWGTQIEYPPPVTYREPTLEDIKNGVEAEFSNFQDFRYCDKGILGGLTGKMVNGKGEEASLWQRRFGQAGIGSYLYCRIAVPQPAIPEGWREITEADKITYGTGEDDPDCDLMSKDGSITLRCYYSKTGRSWKQYCGTDVCCPVYIRARSFN